MKKISFSLLLSVFAIFFLCYLFKENPLLVFKTLSTGFFASSYDLGLTVYYATCFIFTGLAVAIPLRAGLFNIGGEGQLTLGTFATAAVGSLLTSRYLAEGVQTVGWQYYILLLFVGPFAGALIGFITGILKAWRGAHEVIVTMMFNFISAGIVSYYTVTTFQNPDSQSPETSLLAAPLQFVSFADTPASPAFILALVSVLLIWWVFENTALGFDAKVISWGGKLSSRNGISSAKVVVTLMTMAGFFGGAVAWAEVLGNNHQYRMGFSADYGFVGIAVALLAGPRIWTLIPSAFFFAILQKGAGDLDMETQVFNRDFSKVLQAIFILSLGAPAAWDFIKSKILKGKDHA